MKHAPETTLREKAPLPEAASGTFVQGSDQKKSYFRSDVPSSDNKTLTLKQNSIPSVLKSQADTSKHCYIFQKDLSYGHKCSKCKRVICTFPSCCVIKEDEYVIHTCKPCDQNSAKVKARSNSKKRMSESGDGGTGREKVKRHL